MKAGGKATLLCTPVMKVEEMSVHTPATKAGGKATILCTPNEGGEKATLLYTPLMKVGEKAALLLIPPQRRWKK